MLDKINISKEEIKKISLLLCSYLLLSIFFVTPLLSLNVKKYRREINTSPYTVSNMYKHPLLSIDFLRSNPTKLLSLLKLDFILIMITIIIIFIVGNKIETDNIKYKEQDGTHGTSRWMKENEIEAHIKIGDKDGPILIKGDNEAGIMFGVLPNTNKKIKLPYNSFIYNKNVAVFGGPGSGKSRSYVRNNVFELIKAKQSMIFTDPKGELFRDLFVYLKEQNYNVKVFNLVNLLNSDRWNPLSEVTDDLSAQMFTEVIMENTSIPGQSGAQFWEKGEQNLLKALVLYVITELPEEERNLASLYSLIAIGDAKQLDTMFKILPNTHPSKAPYNIFCQASETVRTGIIIGLGTRLQIIQNKKVQELTKANDIDLVAPAKEPCAYFCITSDTNSTFDFLSGLFFSFLFINLINYADLHDGQCNPNIHCLLDEFPNIAAIPDFKKKISTMRSRGVHTYVIFQNIGQLQNRYPNNSWSEILGSCDSKLFLGCTDLLTAEYVSKLLGTSTVEDKSNSKKAGLDGLFDLGKETIKGISRNLLNPDEVLAYPNTDSILMLKGQKPLRLEKFDYSKYRQSKDLKVIQIKDYTPEWAILFKDDLEGKNKDKIILEKDIKNEDTGELIKENVKITTEKREGKKKNVKNKKGNKPSKEDNSQHQQINIDKFFDFFS